MEAYGYLRVAVRDRSKRTDSKDSGTLSTSSLSKPECQKKSQNNDTTCTKSTDIVKNSCILLTISLSIIRVSP